MLILGADECVCFKFNHISRNWAFAPQREIVFSPKVEITAKDNDRDCWKVIGVYEGTSSVLWPCYHQVIKKG